MSVFVSIRSSAWRPKLSGIVISVALTVWLGACSSPFKLTNNETLNTYLLEWKGVVAAVPENPTGRGLLISTPLSSSGFGTSQMVYIEERHRLNAFVRHQWADAPARMLEPLLLLAAERSGLFRAVTNADTRVSADLRLDTQLLYLQQVFGDNASEVQLAIRANLIEITTSRLLGTQVIEVRKSAAERTPYAGVLAANHAVSELLTRLQVFLKRHMCSDDGTCH